MATKPPLSSTKPYATDGGPVKLPTPQPTSPTPVPPATGPGGATSGTSAYDILAKAFQNFGMTITPDLEQIIQTMMKGGYTPDNIDLFMPDIQKTAAFQTRFPGYAKRVANGYNAISVAQYLNLEDQYRSIMANAGMPAGFYDDHSDLGQWIANDVSPDEIQNRTHLAVTAAKQIDPTTRNLMAQFYGLGTGDVAAYFLDPQRALPTIERQYNTAQVATWAQRNGFKVNDITHYEDLVDKGVSPDQAAQGYGSVGAMEDTVGKIAGVYGLAFTQADAENDVFFNQNQKRQSILAKEQATFSGSGRAGNTGSSQRNSY